MSEYTLRMVNADDAQALSDIAARTFVDSFGHLYPPEDLKNYLEDAYNVEKIRGEILDPKRHTVFVFPKDDQSKPCGYAMLHEGSIRTGDVDGNPDDYLEIKRVYVDKPFHGKGAAHVLTKHVMEVVEKKNRKIVWLGVWENNFRAQKFYQKYGFGETGEHIFKVGATQDRDLLYTLQKSA